jgi:pantetheine-phosphate adenylyltransferase
MKAESKNFEAVYAGTFDPVTNGHIDIIERACKVFSSVCVAVAEGGPRTSVKQPVFSSEERVQLIRDSVRDMIDPSLASRVEVESFSGMLVDFVHRCKSRVIVRGLRAVSDYEYETQLAHTNRMLAPDVETIFLVTSEKTSFISSSVVRNVAMNGGDISGMVPSVVVSRFSEKIKKEFR